MRCYLTWRVSGRSRSDDTPTEMRLSRLQFKYAVRKCRANEQIMRADTLAHVLYNRQSTSFWKDVRKMTSSKVSLATKVGDAVDNDHRHVASTFFKIAQLCLQY